MQILKTNWLRAILFSILGLGISFGANASNDKENPKTVKKEVKVEVKKPEKKLATTRLYFQGTNPNDPAQVANPSLWTEDDNAQPCDTGDKKACSMDVNSDDVIPNSLGKLQLNPAEITLIAKDTGAGYVPEKDLANSNSTHPITAFNRN